MSSEEEELSQESLEEDNISQEELYSQLLSYGYSFLPILQSINPEFFDSLESQKQLRDIYGPFFFFSEEIQYCYYRYPVIQSSKVLEEDNLESLQTQITLQRGSEFSLALDFNTEFIDKVCRSSCFPLGNKTNGKENLLVKLHQQRCVMRNLSQNLHVSKSAKKYSKRYMITINADYKACTDAIHKYHKHSWLFPRIRACFDELQSTSKYRTKVFSFELWNIMEVDKLPQTIEELKSNSKCKLVAGEIGYTVGAAYTSLTGYHTENSSGNVQLLATGKLLQKLGYNIWDFGMSMEYKLRLGAEKVPRAEFIKLYKESSTMDVDSFPTHPVLVSSLL